MTPIHIQTQAHTSTMLREDVTNHSKCKFIKKWDTDNTEQANTYMEMRVICFTDTVSVSVSIYWHPHANTHIRTHAHAHTVHRHTHIHTFMPPGRPHHKHRWGTGTGSSCKPKFRRPEERNSVITQHFTSVPTVTIQQQQYQQLQM